ncbi:tetratricopeptide repeat protein [Actinopolymorpha sp. B11F2]|uniref:tetratricopeptide repeat protein n=1 Tax=Actinopolymorpha sp. B11F2 TaxID=3160862 RepID=UPI0032E3D7E5
MPVDDYYALLEVDTAATPEEIRAAITAQRRIWVRRQSSPDPERRAHAEQRVRDIDSAEKILLDPLTRQAYDTARVDERRAARRPQARTRDASGSRRGDTEADEDLAAHLRRGEDYVDQGRWRLAQAEFEYVRERAPDDLRALAGLGAVHVGAGRVKEGLTLLEKAVAEHPDDEDVRMTLATALYDAALAGIGEAGQGYRQRLRPARPMIHSRRQLRLVRAHRRRIRKLELAEWQAKMYVEDLTDLLAQARKPVWTRSDHLKFYVVPFAGATLLAFVPSMEQLRLMGVFWMVVILGVYVLRHRQPGWRYHRPGGRRGRGGSSGGLFGR